MLRWYCESCDYATGDIREMIDHNWEVHKWLRDTVLVGLEEE